MSFSNTRLARSISLGLAVALLAGGPARADGSVSGRIETMLSYQGHNGTLIHLVEGHSDPDGCGGSYWYIFPDTSPRADFVQSMLLTQMKSGHAVTLTLSGCYENYPRIVHIQIANS